MIKRYEPQEDHSHSGYSSWRGTAEIMSLKQEVNIWSKLDTLPRWHGKKTVIIKDRVQGFYPFWVNISITNDP
jgi:hypothetical protein